MPKPELILRTEDHPEAGGRKPQVKERWYTLRFPLEDGRELVLHMGQQGFDVLTNLLIDMMADAPSYSDGTTNASHPKTVTTDSDRLNAIERIGIDLALRKGMWNCLIADSHISQHGVSSRRCVREAIDLAVYQLDKAGVKSCELT